MGMPGAIKVEITTTFDPENNSASRVVRFIGGYGLNMLVASDMSDPDSWAINRSIMADTMGLDDGVYTLVLVHEGPGQFDYKWTPSEKEAANIDLYD